ncbi:MAG TPA: hypothetical protein PKD25_08080 [Rubrivivax sp.]|nr:hypothetical protein [Rubrivivax sp.]
MSVRGGHARGASRQRRCACHDARDDAGRRRRVTVRLVEDLVLGAGVGHLGRAVAAQAGPGLADRLIAEERVGGVGRADRRVARQRVRVQRRVGDLLHRQQRVDQAAGEQRRRQHRAGQLRTEALQVAGREHPAHRVADQHLRQRGVFAARALGEPVHVVDHGLEVGAQHTLAVGAAMPEVVLPEHHRAGRIQPRRDMLVATDVLAVAVT